MQKITVDLINDVVSLMAKGKSLTQVAAACLMSKRQFQALLTSNKEDPTLQQELKEKIELGHTLHESFFESFYIDAMSGKIEDAKEGLIKAYMQNKFRWADKLDTQEKKDKVSEMSDDELQERINQLKNERT